MSTDLVDISSSKSECGFVREKKSALEAERKLYNAGTVSADTMWCHHLDNEGRHVVLNKLPTTSARKCKGVIYVSIGWSGMCAKCGAARAGLKGHDPCTKERCPFMRDTGKCPYMNVGD